MRDQAKALSVAAVFDVDDVIDPASTRERLCSALDLLLPVRTQVLLLFLLFGKEWCYF